jgi:hypothetical protein
VTLNFASWNQVAGWLRQLDNLRAAAYPANAGNRYERQEGKLVVSNDEVFAA